MQRFLLVLLATIFISGLPPQPNSPHFTLKQLAPGVWAAIQNDHYGHAICNAGIIDLGDKTVVFDPFMNPDAARDLKKAAEALTGRPVSLVIDSHYHNDHIRGNQVFVPGANIISTNWTRNEMGPSEKEEQAWEKDNVANRIQREKDKLKAASPAEKDELIMWIGYFEGIQHSMKELKTTIPDIGFTDSMWIYGKKRSIQLIECRNGHTHSDLVALLPQDSIIFMGDLFFVNRHPYLGDGDPASWLNHVHGFRMDPALRTYVPGHGPVGGKAEMEIMEGYLDNIPKLVKKEIQDGMSDSLIIGKPMPAAYQSWWYGRFYKANLEFLCEKMRK